ncbi:hypothetical protein Bca52824_056176 [Brassica carinata]|uniref:C-JID domain-containing protein n=1 Tax=Brassica carinata TaxID=52824 RepID=A0A8X7UF13_BRACI|nr:hypothetical protein Bca52824_056176 [Brassica carinata]
MVLSNSWYLKEIPDLSNATSLEELDLHGCESLLELTSTIGNATKLKRCKLSDCFLLKELPSSMGRLINLQELDLMSTGLKELEKLSSCSSIEELVLCKTSIEEIPPWIENLSHLRKLIMYECKNLKKISPNISKLENLEFLGLGKKDEREHDTSDFGKLKHVSEAVIEWEGPGPKRSWTLISDFKVHYILPRYQKALSLCLGSYGLKTTPDCITRLSGPIKLDVRDCTLLEALGPLPNSLLSIDAEYRYHLKSIDSSFQSSNSCLNFAGCVSLNQNAKELIYTSDCKYALLPGKEVPAHFPHQAASDHLYIFEDSFCLNQDCPEAEDATLSELVFEFICHEVPAHFTYQATSHSLTIIQTPQPLPPSLRFKACILLSRRIINYLEDVSWRLGYLFDDDYVEDEKLLMRVSCWFRSKQNGLTVQYGSYMRDIPYLYGSDDFLYTFEDYICLDQDLPEAAEEATFSKLVFEFKVFYKKWEVKACGVQLLEDDEVGEGDNDGVQEDIKVDVDKNLDVVMMERQRARNDSVQCNFQEEKLNLNTQDKEESGRAEDEDDEVVGGDNDGVEEDIKDDVEKTQEGDESRRDDDAETRSKKRMRFSLP